VSYSIGYGDDAHAKHTGRSAEKQAGFFLPHLRPGMRLLDFGCGPGTITLGLAAAVAPGEVVGIDVEPRQIERARELALQRGAVNLRFEVVNVYRLPFPDESFDAAFGNSVLLHLEDPIAALRELRRVLKGNGMIGVRDGGVHTIVPSTPLIQELIRLLLKIRSPETYDKRRWLLDAGFARSQGSASCESWGTLDETRAQASFLASWIGEQNLRTRIVANGWANEATIEAVIAEILAWGERPDALMVLPYPEAIGWVT
jgi:ubiquinone/menaquinone biosynthesis C-methylase UbiE